MPLELIKEVNGVPEVELLGELNKVEFRSLQPGCDYSKKYIQVRIFITPNAFFFFQKKCSFFRLSLFVGVVLGIVLHVS